ncbi:MAG: glycoside hydrolase family 1 protein [Treponema sp.]|jgi:beta-glucosidase|nr:glycoside hydrolase family 1 protein [Treponema sp.]
MTFVFLLGAASAATQIEGGNISHTWSGWYQKGCIRDGSSPARACDHFRRWREDIDLMAEVGIKVYRLGIEWARLEPARGNYDEAAAASYRELFTYMKSRGIAPLLTIHHFTNPLWFEDIGGFATPANIPVFLGFVEYVVKRFGDLVDEYVTINEPNVFAVMGYFAGEFPPGRRSMRLALRVQSVMASCHIQAYSLIHKLRREMGCQNTKVGFAHHARVFEPKSKNNLWHRLCARLTSRMFQDALTRACLLGRFSFPLKKYGRLRGKLRCKLHPGEYADFLGLNYYTRSTVSKLGDGVREGSPRNDLGWEIYPEGIAICARELHDILARPIYITENGTCDNNDAFRCRFICEHLKVLAESGLPVERYYHWCFTDNFEWCEGESARFGLVHIDYASQKRTLKKSGRFYAAMIKNKGVTDEIYNEFVAPQEYHL